MPESIKQFENSLRDYLINAQTDAHNSIQQVRYRYNNIKIYMDPKKYRKPHFIVSLGISEATFSIEPVDILNGSLSSDTRYVSMWASRPNINGELKKLWLFLTQQSSTSTLIIPDDEEKSVASLLSAKISKERKREIVLKEIQNLKNANETESDIKNLENANETESDIKNFETIQEALKRDNKNIMKPDDEIDK